MLDEEKSKFLRRKIEQKARNKVGKHLYIRICFFREIKQAFFDLRKVLYFCSGGVKSGKMCIGTNPDGYHADDSVGDCGKWKAKLEKADAEKLHKIE